MIICKANVCPKRECWRDKILEFVSDENFTSCLHLNVEVIKMDTSFNKYNSIY